MPERDSRLRANDAECAAKVLDGEAVIINLLNGTYYSLDRAGAVVWELAAGGHTVGEIVDGLTLRYDVDASRAESDVERLVSELLAERLLVSANGAHNGTSNGSANGAHHNGSSNGSSNGAAHGAPANGREPYDVPMLTTYRDMADLLALDPPMPRLEDIVWDDPGGSAPKR
jgi:hypothetical protein